MLPDLFVARGGFWIEAEPLVKIVRLIFAPAVPFQGIVREIEGRFGFEVEHGRGGTVPPRPQILCPVAPLAVSPGDAGELTETK